MRFTDNQLSIRILQNFLYNWNDTSLMPKCRCVDLYHSWRCKIKYIMSKFYLINFNSFLECFNYQYKATVRSLGATDYTTVHSHSFFIYGLWITRAISRDLFRASNKLWNANIKSNIIKFIIAERPRWSLTLPREHMMHTLQKQHKWYILLIK